MKSADQYFYVNLTFNCNQRCIFCVSDETVSHRVGGCRTYMSVERFEQEIRKLSSDIDTIHISGGEPTLHPDLERILQIAAGRFRHVQLATNGICLADNKLLDHLLERTRIQFVIPLFTLDKDIHKSLTGADALDCIIRGLQNVALKTMEGLCTLSLKLIILAQTIDEQSGMLDAVHRMDIDPSEYIVSGLCRTDGAIRSGCVVPYNIAKSRISALARKIIATDKPFCFHRIPLCAFEQDLWPYMMTLDREDRLMEYATAYALYPEGMVKTIPPKHIVNEVCTQCDLSEWCEYASNRNGDKFDYSSEFSPVTLEQTEYGCRT